MHKLIKNVFNITITLLKGLQFLLILFALLTMVDFILFLIGIQLPPFIQVVFDNIYNLQSSFYKPDFSVLQVDFTLAVASVVMLIIAGILVYVLNFIIEFEQTYDKVHADGNKRFEKSFNTKLKENIEQLEAGNKQFAIFYNISIEPVGRLPHMSGKQPVNLEVKESEYRAVLKNIMINSFNAACKHTNEGYILFFENIDNSESIITKMYNYVNKAKTLLKNEMLTINFKAAILMAGRTDNPETYLPKMKKLLTLSTNEKTVILSDFKERYEKLSAHSCKITALGEYSFIDDILDVYSLEPNLQ